MTDLSILDGTGTLQTIHAPNANGQALMAASKPVVIASDQTAVPVTAAALPLPTGAATAANQTSEIALLTSIDSGVNSTVPYLPPTPLINPTDLTASTFLSSSAAGENATPLFAAGGAAVTTRVHRMRVTAAGAATVTFLDGSGGAVLFTLEFPAAGAYVLDFSERPYFKSSANKAIVLSSSTAVKVTAGAAGVQS